MLWKGQRTAAATGHSAQTSAREPAAVKEEQEGNAGAIRRARDNAPCPPRPEQRVHDLDIGIDDAVEWLDVMRQTLHAGTAFTRHT